MWQYFLRLYLQKTLEDWTQKLEIEVQESVYDTRKELERGKKKWTNEKKKIL